MPGSTSSMVGAVDDIILCANAGTAGATRRASAKIRIQIIFVIPPMMALRGASEFVFDVGLWPVGAASGFGVPTAFLVFVLYDFRVPWHRLFFGCRLRSGES